MTILLLGFTLNLSKLLFLPQLWQDLFFSGKIWWREFMILAERAIYNDQHRPPLHDNGDTFQILLTVFGYAGLLGEIFLIGFYDHYHVIFFNDYYPLVRES
jgi:hypothetical protein